MKICGNEYPIPALTFANLCRLEEDFGLSINDITGQPLKFLAVFVAPCH